MRFTILLLSLFICLNTLSTPLLANEKSKLNVIKSKIEKLREQLSGRKNERERIQADIQRSDEEINALQSAIAEVNNERRKINENIASLETKQTTLIEEKRLHQKTLMQQLSVAYQTGKKSKLKMLLSQKNPENIGRLLSYHKYLNIAREEKINALQTTIESLKQLEEEIQKQTWQLSVSEEKLAREKKSLDKAKAKKSALLAKINSDIKSKNKMVSSLSKDQVKLEKLIADIAKRKRQSPQRDSKLNSLDFAKNRGYLNWPVQGKVRHEFNSSISGEIKRAGMFISATEGNAVRAIFDGKVVYADWFQKKGLITIISHGNGYMSLYAHNQSLLNKEGDTVITGERIAVSGQSGNTTRPGLYFEIRKDGKPINPRLWLKK